MVQPPSLFLYKTLNHRLVFVSKLGQIHFQEKEYFESSQRLVLNYVNVFYQFTLASHVRFCSPNNWCSFLLKKNVCSYSDFLLLFVLMVCIININKCVVLTFA